MKKRLNPVATYLRDVMMAVMIIASGLFLISFSIRIKLNADFLQELGISKEVATEKISNSFLRNYLDYYGIKNLKNIATNNRAAIVKDLGNYAKEYVKSDAFKKQYLAMKEENKPTEQQKLLTPEELKTQTIDNAKKFVETSEELVKKATTPDMKKIYEKNLEDAKQNLKAAQDPNNEQYKSYAEGYPTMVQYSKQAREASLKEWNEKYPDNPLLYIKPQLEDFLESTKDIDYAAQLTEKNGKKYFVNPAYEKKNGNWKKAFRAGKETTETARAFVQQWLTEPGFK